MQINERYVKLSSRIPYPKDIGLGEDVTVTIGGVNHLANCVKIEDHDNQDGTIDKVYCLKFLVE
jgi:hypothetical protein